MQSWRRRTGQGEAGPGSGSRRDRRRATAPAALRGSLLLAGASTSGCSAGTLLDQGAPWAWLALPLLALVLVAGLVSIAGPGTVRRPATPGGAPEGIRRDRRHTLLLWALLLAIIAALVFAGLNWRASIEPAVKLRNVGLWFLGTLLGSAGALLLAWRIQARSIHANPDGILPPGEVPSDATELETRNA